ncbi:MAG: LCP family protein [Rubrobacteraceae bacterium]
MGRERSKRRRSSNARRGRRSDPRLRGLSYEERRRVYRRRRIGALVVIAAFLLLVLVVTGIIPLFRGSETGRVSAETASSNQELSRNAGKEAGGDLSGSTEPDAEEQTAAEAGGERPTEAARGEVAKTGADPLNVLVLGVDRRPEESFVEGSRADIVMVVRIIPRSGSVKMLSIPRDLMVEIEPGAEDRVNAAYAYGGVEQASWAVEQITGVTLDRYAVVDFEGFEDIVNAVGGLTVEIQGEMPPERNMEGTQTLDGRQALFYARYRGTPGGDLDRIARQQQLVGALREELISWEAASKLPEIVEAIYDNLETDMGLSSNLSLARSLLKAKDADAPIRTFQLAGSPTTLYDGRQVLIPIPEENERILREFRGEPAPGS